VCISISDWGGHGQVGVQYACWNPHVYYEDSLILFQQRQIFTLPPIRGIQGIIQHLFIFSFLHVFARVYTKFIFETLSEMTGTTIYTYTIHNFID
jgi:hypothetical protein